MLYLALALLPTPAPDRGEVDEGFIGKVVLWARAQLRYRQGLAQLNRLDSRDRDDLDLAGSDFPALAHRHPAGEAPLTPSDIAGLRRL